MLHRKPSRQSDYTGRCGNCHAYIGSAKFCIFCGTKAGEGSFLPYEEHIQCVYGPPPMEREHECSVCGHAWTDCAMINKVKYCPECGGSVTTRDLGYPWERAKHKNAGSSPILQTDAESTKTLFGKVNQDAGRTEDQPDTGSTGDSGYDGLPSDPS